MRVRVRIMLDIHMICACGCVCAPAVLSGVCAAHALVLALHCADAAAAAAETYMESAAMPLIDKDANNAVVCVPPKPNFNTAFVYQMTLVLQLPGQ